MNLRQLRDDQWFRTFQRVSKICGLSVPQRAHSTEYNPLLIINKVLTYMQFHNVTRKVEFVILY